MENQIDIHDKRELDKIGLETYFLDKTNMFDIAIDKLIDQLKSEFTPTSILRSTSRNY